jgi:hypothetical protein
MMWQNHMLGCGNSTIRCVVFPPASLLFSHIWLVGFPHLIARCWRLGWGAVGEVLVPGGVDGLQVEAIEEAAGQAAMAFLQEPALAQLAPSVLLFPAAEAGFGFQVLGGFGKPSVGIRHALALIHELAQQQGGADAAGDGA